MTTIIPIVDVFPRSFEAEELGEMLIAVTNSNTSSKASLDGDDVFQFKFSAGGSLEVRPMTNKVLISSPSKRLQPNRLQSGDFRISQPTKDTIRIEYVAAPKRFFPSESFVFAS